MTRKLVLGVLMALSTAALAQPAAAQWYDQWGWGRGGVGVGVGFGSPGYAYAGYPGGCTCAQAGYVRSYPRASYAYSSYAYPGYSSYAAVGYPYASYGYSDVANYPYSSYGYSDYGYAAPGYATVGLGVRTARVYRGNAGISRTRVAVRTGELDRSRLRERSLARADFDRRDLRTGMRGEGMRQDLHASSGTGVRTGRNLERRVSAGATEGRAIRRSQPISGMRESR
jgi:hypothetical protein